MKAKLQKQLAYEYKGKQYFKHVLIVPDDAVKELGWNGGQELEVKVENKRLIVKTEKKTRG